MLRTCVCYAEITWYLAGAASLLSQPTRSQMAAEAHKFWHSMPGKQIERVLDQHSTGEAAPLDREGMLLAMRPEANLKWLAPNLEKSFL